MPVPTTECDSEIMAIKTGILFLSLVLGAIALPAPESDDLSQFFDSDYPESRIVGGNIADEGSHPHMAAMTSGRLVSSFSCGGSIISPRSILTAAHCIHFHYSFGSVSNSVRIVVGTNNWYRGGSSYRVSGNATHPNYVHNLIKNDIGILFTSSAISFNARTQPISINFDYIGAGVEARAAGWGRTSVNSAIPQQLREVDLPTISGEQCVTDAEEASVTLNIGYPGVQPHLEICTLHPSGPGMGTCRGDSGSALVELSSKKQIGIVSWGFPCALGAPDVYVRVSAYESWVAQNIRN